MSPRSNHSGVGLSASVISAPYPPSHTPAAATQTRFSVAGFGLSLSCGPSSSHSIQSRRRNARTKLDTEPQCRACRCFVGCLTDSRVGAGIGHRARHRATATVGRATAGFQCGRSAMVSSLRRACPRRVTGKQLCGLLRWFRRRSIVSFPAANSSLAMSPNTRPESTPLIRTR